MKIKEYLKSKGITSESTADEIKAAHDSYFNELEERISKASTKEDTEKMLEETLKDFKDYKSDSEKAAKELNGRLSKLEENADKGGKKVGKTLEVELKENKEELKSIAKGLSSKEVIIKADTLRASITGNQQAFELNTIGQLAHAKLTAYDIFNKIPIRESNNNGVIRYYDWDQATIVRNAANIAEGVAFPESTAKWVTKTIDIQKIGDTLPVSEEFFEDEAMFAAELNMFLDTNVRIKRNDQIVNGDGTGVNLTGIFTSIDAFSASASGISDASIYDLFVKVKEDITSVGGSKYSPDFALMNISDINLMKLKKDANDNYIMPPFANGVQNVDGMVVLEENSVAANTMIIGDRRFARIYEKLGIALSRGMVANQFIEDMETLKARTRLAFLIRGADKGGFLKVTDIAAALVTLAA